MSYEPGTPKGPDVRWQDNEWNIVYWDETKTSTPCYQVYHNKHYAVDTYTINTYNRMRRDVVCATCRVMIPVAVVGFYKLLIWER